MKELLKYFLIFSLFTPFAKVHAVVEQDFQFDGSNYVWNVPEQTPVLNRFTVLFPPFNYPENSQCYANLPYPSAPNNLISTVSGSGGLFYYCINPREGDIYQIRMHNAEAIKDTDPVVYFQIKNGLPIPYHPNTPDCCSNVLFLPGIEASRLYNASDNKKWEPFTNAEIPDLYMTSEGKSIDPAVHTKDIIDRFKAFSLVGPSIYESFIKKMDNLVLENTINSWKPFPYDWRYSASDIVNNGIKTENQTIYLKNEIETLASNSKTGKVTIIAHSNGGLVAKELMRQLDEEERGNLVDKVLLIGVPQLGTPDAIAAMLHGMELGGGFILDKATSRKFAENMPGVYGLLPSDEYFHLKGSVIYFTPDSSEYGNFIDNSTEFYDFLSGAEGRLKPDFENIQAPNILQGSMLEQAKNIHDKIDDWFPLKSKVIEIAGWGKDTLRGLVYKDGSVDPVYTKDGDKTVITESAGENVLDSDTYFFNISKERGITHKNLLESNSLQTFIEKIIKQENVLNIPNITTAKPQLSELGKTQRVSVHSPVTIDLYDLEGHHTGLIPDNPSDVEVSEENVAGSSYFEFGEGKYIELDPTVESSVRLQGIGAGTFTFAVEKLDGDTIEEQSILPNIPVTPDLKAIYNVTESGSPTLLLDVEGDGVVDFAITQQEADDPTLFFDILRKMVDTLGLEQSIKQQLTQKIDKVIKSISKNKEEQVTAAIKQFSQIAESKKWSKKLSEEQKQTLVKLINSLLDSIK